MVGATGDAVQWWNMLRRRSHFDHVGYDGVQIDVSFFQVFTPEPEKLEDVVDQRRHLFGFDDEKLDMLSALFVEFFGIVRKQPIR